MVYPPKKKKSSATSDWLAAQRRHHAEELEKAQKLARIKDKEEKKDAPV